MRLGTAFQMQDDILGIWGRPEATGKPTGRDILDRKVTLPLLVALETAAPPDQRRLRHLWTNGATLDVGEVIALLDRAKAREAARVKAREVLGEAAAIRDELPLTAEAHDAISEFTAGLVDRNT